MKKFSVFLLMILILSSFTPLLAAEESLEPDSILLADVPILYGDESFRARILERTKGERDPIGLVLTGGSARAFAHLGVLAYLEDIGVQPDYIIANSMGAIIGMLYSAGLSPDQILSVITSGELSSFFKLTAPIDGGVLEPDGFKGLIEAVTGSDLKLEDLPIPTMIICQDLVTKREVRIMEGDFSDVLIAAFAIPVYFPPVEYRGHLLVDGGIVTIAPISVAFDYSDTVIASTTFYDNEGLNLKNPLTIINSSFDVGKRERAASELRTYGDRMIWIRCAVEQFSFMEFSASAELAEIGYQSAAEHSEELEQLYKHPLDEEFLANRESMQANIDKAANDLRYFSRISQPDISNLLSIGLHSFQGDDYPYYLRDSLDLGIEYSWNFRSLEVSVLTGGAFSLSPGTKRNAALLFSGNLNYYPISQLRLSLYSALTFNGVPRWYAPTVYMRQGIDYAIISEPDVKMQLSQAFELSNSFGGSFDDDQLLLSVLFRTEFSPTSFLDLRMHSAYLLTLKGLSSTPRNYAEVAVGTRIYFVPGFDFFLDYSVLGRFALDGINGVPMYIADGFATNSSALYYGWDSNMTQDYLFLMPMSLGYAFNRKPTFGELFMFENVEVSAYCDLLFRNGGRPYVSTGAELQCVASFIGLQKMPMTLRLGYDEVSSSFVWSVRFAVTP